MSQRAARSGIPLYRQVADPIREKIRAGQLGPGMRVPSEPELAGQYRISRMTARRALDDLVNEGLVVRHRGRGTFVAEPRLTYPPASLFSFTRTMAKLGYKIATKLLALELVATPGSVVGELDLEDGEIVLLVRRLRFVDGSPVALHESYMERTYLDGLLASDLLTRPIGEAMERVTGVRIVASEDYLEAASASKEEAELLSIGIGNPVQLLIGVASTEAGKHVLATRAVYRADRFRFIVAAHADDVSFEIRTPAGRDGVAGAGSELVTPASVPEATVEQYEDEPATVDTSLTTT